MLKGQPPKFNGSVCNFPISKIGNSRNSLFRPADSNSAIFMELKRKVECSWACTFWPVRVSRGIESNHTYGIE